MLVMLFCSHRGELTAATLTLYFRIMAVLYCALNLATTPIETPSSPFSSPCTSPAPSSSDVDCSSPSLSSVAVAVAPPRAASATRRRQNRRSSAAGLWLTGSAGPRHRLYERHFHLRLALLHGARSDLFDGRRCHGWHRRKRRHRLCCWHTVPGQGRPVRGLALASLKLHSALGSLDLLRLESSL